jgi:hypothetical protein
MKDGIALNHPGFRLGRPDAVNLSLQLAQARVNSETLLCLLSR